MKTIQRHWVSIFFMLAIAIIVSGCAAQPKLSLKVATAPDMTGAIKYQLWTGYIQVSYNEKEKDLEAKVARNPYEPIILMSGKDAFWSDTKITYAPLDNTKMPKKITVAFTDKTEKRIEQAGEVGKALVSMAAFAMLTDIPGKGGASDSSCIENFKPWTLNLAQAVKDPAKWKNTEMNFLSKDEYKDKDNPGIGPPPNNWTYGLYIEPASKTAVDITTILNDKDLENLGNHGVLPHPGCRAAKLTLTGSCNGKEIVKVLSFAIPDPKWIETVMLPTQGSVTFSECSVEIDSGDVNKVDYFSDATKLVTTAKSVWDTYVAEKEKKEKEKTK